jgi:hypothetical protein
MPLAIFIGDKPDEVLEIRSGGTFRLLVNLRSSWR